MTSLSQTVLFCPCGRDRVLAKGLCATCYSLRQQDRKYFAGLREEVLRRDGYRCRVCQASGRSRRRSLAVHHRVPGRSRVVLMITLCPGCHARVSRTLVLDRDWPPLLRKLWREQHPLGHEQHRLNFRGEEVAATREIVYG